MRILVLLFIAFFTFDVNAQTEVTFPSKDGLEITADLYLAHPASHPMIILFHQARWSRGEYREIAPKLNKLGYNCIAIDQRSGGEVLGVTNKTYKRAVEKGVSTKYTAALKDMNAAIDHVKENYPNAKKLIIWGSSYSSALVLKIAGDRNDVDAVLSFAPGEYFRDEGKPSNYIVQSAENILVQAFITYAKNDKEKGWKI